MTWKTNSTLSKVSKQRKSPWWLFRMISGKYIYKKNNMLQ